RLGPPVGDDDVGLPVQDRLDQLGDPLLRVLVVAVGQHDDVGAQVQGSGQPVPECVGQALLAGVGDEVLDPQLAGHFGGTVGRAVVDDQYFDAVHAGNGLRHVLEDQRQRRLFVEARNHDDELHSRPFVRAQDTTHTSTQVISPGRRPSVDSYWWVCWV